MPHHTSHPVAAHSHGGSGATGVAHGFITLHPVDPAHPGTGVAKVVGQHDAGVSASPAQGLVVVYVEDTLNSSMSVFHQHLDDLANKYIALVNGGGALFDFEHHF